MPAEITCDRDELLAAVTANRDKHRAIFLKAQEGYRERVIYDLDEALRRVRGSHHAPYSLIMRLAELPVPTDHTDDYDREIRMLQMHQDKRIAIDERRFDQLVMDNWGWKAQWTTTNTKYL